MQSTLPGPCEFVVTSLHGSAAISDGEFPINISPSSRGAIITAKAVGIGKIHFALPTLRSLEEETTLGKLTGYAIASTRLEVLVSPHGQPATNSHSKIIQVELYAGRDQVGSWENSDDDCLPTNQDVRLDVDADIVGAGDNPFTDNPSGLCVTLTAEFVSSESALLVSSVALVQTVGPRKKVN
ncbi:uncharacterized protein BKA55DRAFT_681681 [Fusarium redolens]|uniref:Uncharacterized protein n=1 Tax=Fusarium redolens TaxID=48865 RepID=A0A9P9FUU4_FUSRE|nr:uncharacterized protein BKA55DRAFT_681681 [Fusarium redolens]KAH7207899.1 hypothetical protein BKA55DRAFT_681681 [Fusarium redolens]